MRNYQAISYSKDASIAEIRFNRPNEANSINRVLLAELLKAVSDANNDEAIRAVILSSAGKLFCAGADLKDTSMLEQGTQRYLMDNYYPVFAAIKNSDKPYIAQVQGGAAGIGTSLVMICDLAVMSSNAYMYQAFSPISLIPDGGANWLLYQQLGHKKAFELIAFAERLPAAQCAELGLVNAVVEPEELATTVQEWAQRLVDKAPLSLSNSKRLLHAASNSSYEQVFELEAETQGQLEKSQDAKEGIMAFLQKRKANFKGC